ncbi:zinc finger protein (macronuclear) [Tetrahymena thermophila SB210]|uniref:Zinc finger protein n=1 Tax=Tetrahymena thermophila (strain SB210) TaxID=312017 RepID=Q22UF4_TETTS|nr:zinc finger protein [Tetrahymena thermophila SB210]EAR88733.2 zinc finger protein [Tetrahymena thermophila SB210]|eukprot:XP_001008978.2 zinc finger protein [Tetrahymena thermophila SB210]
MNSLKFTFYIFVLVKFCISLQCEQNEIYSLVTQSCLQCSNECQTCFNTKQSSCITCKQNLFKSSNDDSACVQKCQINEFQNENNECVKCQVFGCVSCDESQKCLECDQNLKLDQINNQCILMDNVCSYFNGFIQGTSNLEKCQKECQPTFYQNMEAQTCEDTISCIQIQESKRFSFEKRVIEVQQINQNQYLVEAYGCTFALLDQNWNIINVQVLQNLENYNDLYVVDGVEIQRNSFIVGDQGGCSAGSRIVVVNFKTLEVVFQLNNTNYDYSVSYVDSKNQIAFLNLNNGNTII